MTVREIFELRKQGRVEEAYEAIRPMYASHKGKYTTLCMFWTAHDVLKLRLEQGRIDEARKIYQALQRLLPNLEDRDGAVAASMQYARERLEGIKPAEEIKKPCHPCHPCLNKPQQSVLDCIRENPGLRVPKISEATNIPSKSIERHIKALISHGLIEHRGSKKTGGYYAK